MSAPIPTYAEFLAQRNENKVAICARCRVPLNTLTEVLTGEVTFTHSQAYNSYDHEPIPQAVERNSEDIATDCDFCGTRREMHWSFVGENVSIDHPWLDGGERGDLVTNNYGERWAACKECGEAINRNDIEQLAQIAQERSRVVRKTPPAQRGTLLASFQYLWSQYIPTIYQRDYIGPRTEPTRLNPRLMPKIQLGLMNFWGDDFGYGMILRKGQHQDLYAIPGVHAGQEDVFSVSYPPGSSVPPQVWRNHLNHLRAGVGTSQLYWISPKFTQLAIMAGKDLDKIVITREELPSTFGVMVFEDPIGEVEGMFGPARVRAVSWTLVPGGIWINLYIQPEDGAPSSYDVLDGRRRYGYLLPINYGGGLEFGDEAAREEYLGPDGDGRPDLMATVLAAWFLLAQPGVAETSTAPADKKLARSYQREHHRPLPDVLLVDLRKPPVRSHGDRESGPRGPYKYRVYRRGHWKRQAYGPKRGLRKTIYVSPYIAGPENAPLKDSPRPTVRVLR